jgi:hypothetical protein
MTGLPCDFVDAFWDWAEIPQSKRILDINRFSVDPVEFPMLEQMQRACIACINNDLPVQELDAFLMCLAIDNESERILDACKSQANELFLHQLISNGVNHPQSGARWQIAELLRRDIPDRERYLKMLLQDKDAYVRKRAGNVLEQE